ncbi:hypothetical protein J874_3460, partial [Acinetobacter baumannii 44467_1]
MYLITYLQIKVKLRLKTNLNIPFSFYLLIFNHIN